MLGEDVLPDSASSSASRYSPMVTRQLGFFVLAASLALSLSNLAEAKSRSKAHHSSSASAGMASVYATKGDGYAGKRTASGERAQSGALTAAHKSLPFGTMVRVTNKRNNKSVVVRSVYHNGGCHKNLPMYTGFDVNLPDEEFRESDPPSMGSVLAYVERDADHIDALHAMRMKVRKRVAPSAAAASRSSLFTLRNAAVNGCTAKGKL